MRSLLLILGWFFAVAEARADTYAKLLDDAFPTSVARADFGPSSFRVEGLAGLPAGSTATLDPQSIQWGRVDDRLVFPRARVTLEIPNVESVQATVQHRTTPFVGSRGEVLLPLVSGRASDFSVTWKTSKGEFTKALHLERNSAEDYFHAESSCSSSNVELSREQEGVVKGAWAALDCRWIREESGSRGVPTLDLLLFWDGEEDGLKVNGTSLPAVEPSVFHLRLRPGTDTVRIETRKGERFKLRYRLPPEMNLGFLGLGVGPYRYRLLGAGTNVSANTALLTVYGSYQLGESVKLTAFNATAIHRNFFTDTGVYLKTDSFHFFDRRVAAYLMFGANVVGFKFASGSRFRAGAPQGFEAVVRDFLRVNRSLTLGAFIYPPIDGKSYYNVWLRYGSPAFFAELNYIAIRDRFDQESVYSRSAGVSIGFPLVRLF